MNGTVSLDPLGTFNYQPKLDFVGMDEFQYKMCDTDPIALQQKFYKSGTISWYKEELDPVKFH